MHATVPAACGRSPLRNEWTKLLSVPPGNHIPGPVGISDPLIPILYGQADARTIPERFPAIKTWAVPVHKAMDRRGSFRSADMKDYLGLPSDRRLMLSTAAPDDYMEMLWEKGDTVDYRKHGFDLWCPAHFSIYDNDSKFYQFFNARRQQIHARRSGSQLAWFRLGEHIPVWWLEPVLRCPSILISCQQMHNGHNRRLLAQEIELADTLLPLTAEFFLLGSGYGVRIQESRTVHEIRADWLIRGLKGQDMQRVSHTTMPRQELLQLNLTSLYRSASERHLQIGMSR